MRNAPIAGTVSSTPKQNTNAVKTSLGWLAGNISDADFFGNKLCVRKNVTFDEYESVAYMPKKLSLENEFLETSLNSFRIDLLMLENICFEIIIFVTD